VDFQHRQKKEISMQTATNENSPLPAGQAANSNIREVPDKNFISCTACLFDNNRRRISLMRRNKSH